MNISPGHLSVSSTCWPRCRAWFSCVVRWLNGEKGGKGTQWNTAPREREVERGRGLREHQMKRERDRRGESESTKEEREREREAWTKERRGGARVSSRFHVVASFTWFHARRRDEEDSPQLSTLARRNHLAEERWCTSAPWYTLAPFRSNAWN